jgi:hypothetical protein
MVFHRRDSRSSLKATELAHAETDLAAERILVALNAATVEQIELAIFDEIFHLNVLGPIVAMQAVISRMRTQGGGSIVNSNSGTAFMTMPVVSEVYRLSRLQTSVRIGWGIHPAATRVGMPMSRRCTLRPCRRRSRSGSCGTSSRRSPSPGRPARRSSRPPWLQAP